MSTAIQQRENERGLGKKWDPQDVSALLALMHGKSDSICRLFKREICVDKSELSSLNDKMTSKLALHDVSGIITSIDITFLNKRVITFKTWPEFEQFDFESINSATKSILIQWDFLATLKTYEVPQRHTVSVRISSTPNPSDFFKVLLSGGFDEAHDFDIQSSTMICKVDFVNNTLAEELINVAEHWNELCETPYAKKGKIQKFLAYHRNGCANIFEVCSLFCVSLIVAIIFKLCIQRSLLTISGEFLLYALIGVIPISFLVKRIAHAAAQKIYSSFVANAIFSIVLSIVFFLIGA